MKNEMVTIAMHTGKKEYYPLVENFLKSFLLCVTYPKIELMLVETAGNEEIRSWFNSLDFSKNFINFDGTETSIKRNESCEIIKSLVYLDPDPNDMWYMSWTKGINEAIRIAKGKYFTMLAEDNQFNMKGDIISGYISLLRKEDRTRSLVHFFSQQGYKYFKKSNAFTGPSIIGSPGDFDYFTVNQIKECTKWCFLGLTDVNNYKLIGEPLIAQTKDDNPHIQTEEYSKRSHYTNYKRFYPKICHGIWLSNNSKKLAIKTIVEKTKNNPDYVLYKIHNYDRFKKGYFLEWVDNAIHTRPSAIDDFCWDINE